MLAVSWAFTISEVTPCRHIMLTKTDSVNKNRISAGWSHSWHNSFTISCLHQKMSFCWEWVFASGTTNSSANKPAKWTLTGLLQCANVFISSNKIKWWNNNRTQFYYIVEQWEWNRWLGKSQADVNSPIFQNLFIHLFFNKWLHLKEPVLPSAF